MDDLKRRREFEQSIRDRIEVICDRNRTDMVVELLLQGSASARDTYLGLLKLLGRNDTIKTPATEALDAANAKYEFLEAPGAISGEDYLRSE